MRQKRLIKLVIFIVAVGYIIFNSYNKKTEDTGSETPESPEVNGPTSETGLWPSSTTNAVVHHEYFSLSYSEPYEQAEWVAYELKKEQLTNDDRERPYFNPDPKVRSGSADWRNYKNSGYDRGHLCPAGDRRFSVFAYNQTFLTSNIAPQEHDFNSGLWNRLEQQTRYWAKKYDGLFVVSGGVLVKNLKVIGKEKVAVPEYFYKILYDGNKGNPKMIAFLVPHKESGAPLDQFVVTIDKVENLTGINFFPALNDSLEERLESKASPEKWF